MSTPYDRAFFDSQQANSRRSAEHVVPLVVDAVRPSSVVDVGCGVGTWLAVFAQNGVSDIIGLDGEYVDRTQLHISPDRFVPTDLSKPPRLHRSFDLAVSLEVAEHLPSASAQPFVEFLVSLAPVVLFSAAIPGQGGVDHLNEQWQDWWAGHFAQCGYRPVDLVRQQVWNNLAVEMHYAQNTLLYVREDHFDRWGSLHNVPAMPLRLVHPRGFRGLWETTCPSNQSVRRAGLQFCRSLARAIGRRIGWREMGWTRLPD